MEKIFNAFVVHSFMLCGWILRALRLLCGWKNTPIVEGNGTGVILHDEYLNVLCQRHPIHGWQFVGGGVGYNEKGFKPQQGNLFRVAAERELLEEVGFTDSTKNLKFVAATQQRTAVGGVFSTGSLFLYSLGLTEEELRRWPLERFHLQRGEVSEIAWVPILEAITNSGPRKFAISYRRLLLVFLHLLKRGDTSPNGELFGVPLGSELTLSIGTDSITV